MPEGIPFFLIIVIAGLVLMCLALTRAALTGIRRKRALTEKLASLAAGLEELRRACQWPEGRNQLEWLVAIYAAVAPWHDRQRELSMLLSEVVNVYGQQSPLAIALGNLLGAFERWGRHPYMSMNRSKAGAPVTAGDVLVGNSDRLSIMTWSVERWLKEQSHHHPLCWKENPLNTCHYPDTVATEFDAAVYHAHGEFVRAQTAIDMRISDILSAPQMQAALERNNARAAAPRARAAVAAA